VYWLDFRTRDVGGPVRRTPALFRGSRYVGDGLSLLPPSSEGVTFVAHGFNNSRDEGVRLIRGFVNAAKTEVPQLRGTRMVGVLWPGDAIFGFLSYPTEESDADETADAFAETLLAARLPQPVHFVAHSLGSRMLLRTLTLLVNADPNTSWADQIVLMAAAVDNDCLARGDRYAVGVENASRLLNLASTNDRVLRYAFPAGDWFAGVFTGGYTRTALGRRGPAASPRPPSHVHPHQIPDADDVRHGHYLGGGPDARRLAASRFTGKALERIEPLRYSL
jgi:esterase/lipase superfamily enzyme